MGLGLGLGLGLELELELGLEWELGLIRWGGIGQEPTNEPTNKQTNKHTNKQTRQSMILNLKSIPIHHVPQAGFVFKKGRKVLRERYRRKIQEKGTGERYRRKRLRERDQEKGREKTQSTNSKFKYVFT